MKLSHRGLGWVGDQPRVESLEGIEDQGRNTQRGQSQSAHPCLPRPLPEGTEHPKLHPAASLLRGLGMFQNKRQGTKIPQENSTQGCGYPCRGPLNCFLWGRKWLPLHLWRTLWTEGAGQ